MAITLDNTPINRYLSRNQIAFRFNCPDVVTTAEVKEYRWAIISEAIENDDTLTIEWSYDGTDYSIQFTFKDSPDAANYEIESNDTAPDEDYILNTLIPGLLSHPDISEFFDIRVEEDTFYGFRMVSRVSGPVSLTFTASGFTPTEVGVSGVAEVRETDYLASVWVYMANAHNSNLLDFTKIGELELYPDSDNKADIDVADIIDSFFSNPETPTDTVNNPVLCTELAREFFLLYGQKFGDPVERKKQGRTDIYTVIKGGMRHNEFVADIGSLIPNATKWRYLTIRSRREVEADQKDWLFFHTGPHEISSAQLDWEIFFTDGSTQTGQGWTNQTLTPNKTYQTPAGFTQRGLNIVALQLAKTAYKYTIQILGTADGDDVSTEKATFYIMSPDHLATVFQYENTLGGIESWRMVGNRTLTGSKSSQPYRRPLPPLSTAGYQELMSYNEEDTPAITFNTGPMSQSDALAFRDFLRSRHKWLLTTDGDRIPFRITDTDYALDSENLEADYTRNFEFKAILAPSKGISLEREVWK